MRWTNNDTDTLHRIVSNAGEDIAFVASCLPVSTFRSRLDRLKKRGLAYTHRADGVTEVWPTKSGEEKLKRLGVENCSTGSDGNSLNR